MDLNYQQFVPADFDNSSKVWIYQSSRLLSLSEALELEDLFADFTANWNSHGAPVKGYANLLYGQFIVLMADETATGVSGCSTDSSVHLIKKIEQLFHINLFNRQHLAFIIKDKVEVLPLAQLNYALANQFITPDTLYFNNLVATKKSFLEEWLVPVKASWLASRIPVLN